HRVIEPRGGDLRLAIRSDLLQRRQIFSEPEQQRLRRILKVPPHRIVLHDETKRHLLSSCPKLPRHRSILRCLRDAHRLENLPWIWAILRLRGSSQAKRQADQDSSSWLDNVCGAHES